MKIKVRSVKEKDLEQICQLGDKVAQMHRRRRLGFIKIGERPRRSSGFYLKALKSEGKVIFVAEVEKGVFAGYVLFSVEKKPGDLIDISHVSVDEFAVVRKYHRSGIGKALMEKVHQWASKKGLKVVQLQVWEFNRGALEFYERLGYKIIARRMEKILS